MITFQEALARLASADLPGFSNIALDSVHARTILGETPLHIAAIWGDLEMAQALVEGGASVDAAGEHGFTPLHEALHQGHIAVAEYLRSAGASIAYRNSWNQNAVDICEQCDDPLVRSFLHDNSA